MIVSDKKTEFVVSMLEILGGFEKAANLKGPWASFILCRLNGWEEKPSFLTQKGNLFLQCRNFLCLGLDQFSDLLSCHNICFPRALEGIALLEENTLVFKVSFGV